MSNSTTAPKIPPPRDPIPDIEAMRQAAMAVAMRGHLVYAEDADRWLAYGGEKWVFVEDDAVDEFFAHPVTQERVIEIMCDMAELHYQKTMARLEEYREKYPAAYVDALEPYVRARAELELSRDELNAAAAELWEKQHPQQTPRRVQPPMIIERSGRGAF